MRYILFLSALIVAAFTNAPGQERESSLEKGQIEDLKGITKVYVGPSNQPVTFAISDIVRKKLPQITFVLSRDEADVLLLFSEERHTEADSNPGPSLDGRSSVKFVNVIRSQGRVIRVGKANPAKLIKKFSATGRSGDSNKLARDFAEEFIKLYRKANSAELTSPGILSQEPEPPVEEGGIEDLKGVTRVFVAAPDHYSSLFLRKIVETIRKKIPDLVFVWDKTDADVWLLFSAEGNVLDVRVRGKIIRSVPSGQLRRVKQYEARGNKGADGFAEEFVKAYQKVNPIRQADVARLQQTTSLSPRLLGERGPVAVTGVTTSPRNSANGAEVGDGDVLRVDTTLVTILANVIGRDGKPASGMSQEDFSVYEDDIKQNIAFFEPVDRPFSVVLLIDSSTSVESQFKEILKAAKVLVERLRPDDQLVIVTFDAMVKEVLKLTKIRDLRGEMIQISPQGGTRLYDAVDFAASQYLRRIPGRKAVVLLTDGLDLGSFMTTAEGSLHDAEEYEALFYPIQYKTSESQPVQKTEKEYERATTYLRELAEKTGGRYQRAEDLADISPAFAAVVKELSSQYSLGYYPARPPQPGELRRIQVRVSQPGLIIHTRNSYVSGLTVAKPSSPK